MGFSKGKLAVKPVGTQPAGPIKPKGKRALPASSKPKRHHQNVLQDIMGSDVSEDDLISDTENT
eukprot:1178351-Prorocentrum_minimum.AAC.4